MALWSGYCAKSPANPNETARNAVYDQGTRVRSFLQLTPTYSDLRYIGRFLSEHSGQYYAAMNNFLGTAMNADAVKQGVGFSGDSPIPQADL